MSEIKTFFRFCPSCGRRFHIKLTSKKIESTESHVGSGKAIRFMRGVTIKGPNFIPPGGFPSVLLEEKVPMVFGEDEFQYSYKCKHCGREWSEMHEEDHETKAPPGYTGD